MAPLSTLGEVADPDQTKNRHWKWWSGFSVVFGAVIGTSIPTTWAQSPHERIIDEQHQLGVVALPTRLPEGMAQGFVETLMTPHWKNGRFQASGVNYWSVGWIANGLECSSRFDPDSKFYQAWAGVYVARSDIFTRIGNLQSLPIQEIGQLAELDQKAWLDSYGDPNPKAQVVRWTPTKESVVDGRRAFVFYGEISSHSDVSEVGTNYSDLMVRGFRTMNAGGSLPSSFFIPAAKAWKGKVSRFHDILLRGYFVVVPIAEKGTIVCIYANGARFRKLDGTTKDTFEVLDAALQSYVSAVKIKPAQ